MHWNSVADFLAMGGYAPFVWPAFALAAAVLTALVVASLRQLRAAEATLAAAEQSSGRRRVRRAAAAQEHAGDA
jgi:heme exporter protein D